VVSYPSRCIPLSSDFQKSRTQVLACGANLLPSLLSLLGTMLPRAPWCGFSSRSTAGHVGETWRWVGHLRAYSYASLPATWYWPVRLHPASGPRLFSECGAELLLAVAVILPMGVSRVILCTREMTSCSQGWCSSLQAGQELCKRSNSYASERRRRTLVSKRGSFTGRRLNSSSVDCVRALVRRPTTGRTI
jgi:hypothetical protein